MRIMRVGLLFLPLMLAACSIPTKQSPQTPPTAEPTQSETAETPKQAEAETKPKKQESKTSAPSSKELINELQMQQKLALQNIEELDLRVGSALNSPDSGDATSASYAALAKRVKNLKEFNNSLSQQIVELDKRVEQRRQQPKHGDTLQVYLSDLEVDKAQKFHAQPLVGHWVRGESRVVRLNENLLAENSNSEPLSLTFSEKYQVLINGKLIGSFGPDRNKYELDFEAPTADETGTIEGALTIRIQGN